MNPHEDTAGDWQGLDSPGQAPRYAAIAEMLRRLQADAKVLDVGCGEGVLRSWLPARASYTGIERSRLAARSAAAAAPSAVVVNASAEQYEASAEHFDSIVFSEMLYYVSDPVGLVRRYVPLLSPGGLILCSIYQSPKRVRLRSLVWRVLDPRRPLSAIHCEKMVRAFMKRDGWQILDDRTVPLPDGDHHWHVWAARPPQAALRQA